MSIRILVSCVMVGCWFGGDYERVLCETASAAEEKIVISKATNGNLVISNGKTQISVPCDKGYIWGDNHVTNNKQDIFVLRHKTVPSGGRSPDAVVRIVFDRKSPIKKIWRRGDVSFVGDGNPVVRELYAISDDGVRLLVLAAFTEQLDSAYGKLIRTKYYPCFLDSRTGVLTEVVP